MYVNVFAGSEVFGVSPYYGVFVCNFYWMYSLDTTTVWTRYGKLLGNTKLWTDISKTQRVTTIT